MQKLLLLFFVLFVFACKKEESGISSSSIKINYKLGSSFIYAASATAYLDDTTSLNQDETYYHTDTFEISYPKDTMINQKKYIVEVRKKGNVIQSTSYLEITDSSINVIGYKYLDQVILYPDPYFIYPNPLTIGANWEVNSMIDTNYTTMKVLRLETLNINQQNYHCAVIGYNEQNGNNSFSIYTEHLDENGMVKQNTEFKKMFRTSTSAGMVHSIRNVIRIQ